MSVRTMGAQPVKHYAMERTGADEAEIVLYGDIVSERPTDWDGEPIEGQYIILSEFLEDLKQVEDVKSLTIRIHSAGGNAFDAITIHNRLKSIAAEKTVIVDGVAMSGGSLIMAAGDRVLVYPGSIVMIHKCWTFLFGGYNATELRVMADSNDVVDRSQAAIYHEKTNLDTDKILSMMEAETYMSGSEAVEMGFADELVEGGSLDIAASADRRTLYAGGIPVWVSTRKGGIPASIPTVKPEGTPSVQTNTNTPDVTGNDEGGNSMTAEELRREHPEAVAKIEAEARASAAAPAAGAAQVNTDPQTGDGTAQAVSAERERIKAIDEIAGCLDPALVREAKYGDNACSASELALRAVQAAARSGQAFLGQMERDANASGTRAVSAAPGEDPNAPKAKEATTSEQKLEHARAQVAHLFGKEEKKNG